MTGAAGDNMLARTARGAGWMVGWRLATRLLGLGSTLVLARILTPDDFGLIALATSFAIALEVVLELGLEDQIIRARQLDRSVYDTAFTLNLLRAVLIGLLVAAAAGWAARFFGDPRLELLVLILAVTTAFSGLKNLGVVEFRRNLDFAMEFRLMILPRLASVAATLVLAFLLQSYWALIIGIVVARVGTVAMSYIVHPYRPRLSLALWREMAGVSFWTWAISMVIMVRDRSEAFVIGRLDGPAAVGVYALGSEIATLPTTEVMDPIARAAMPGYAAAMREQGASGTGEALTRIVAVTSLVTIPASLGISAVAAPLVLAAFGPKWLDAVPVVALLGAACTMMSFRAGATLLRALARLRTLCVINAATMLARLGLLLLLVPRHGLTGAAIAVAVSLLVEQAFSMHLAAAAAGVRWAALLREVWRGVASGAVMALALWWSGLGWGPVPEGGARAIGLVLEAVALGAVVYGLVLVALWQVSG